MALMLTVLIRILHALSLVTASVSATNQGIPSAGAWVIPFVVEAEVVEVVAVVVVEVELLLPGVEVEGEVGVAMDQVVEAQEVVEEVAKRGVEARNRQVEAKKEVQEAKKVEGEVEVVVEAVVVVVVESKVNVPQILTALLLTRPAANGVTANVLLISLVILIVGGKVEEEVVVLVAKAVEVVVEEAEVEEERECVPLTPTAHPTILSAVNGDSASVPLTSQVGQTAGAKEEVEEEVELVVLMLTVLPQTRSAVSGVSANAPSTNLGIRSVILERPRNRFSNNFLEFSILRSLIVPCHPSLPSRNWCRPN